VIHKSLRNFRTRLRNNQDRHTAERSISISRESLQGFFCVCVLGAVAYLQVSPLGGSRDETWRGQGIRKRPVLEFAKTTSIVTMQRRCRAMYHTEPPKDKTIREWYMKFQQSGCLCAAKRTGRPRPSAETVESVRETLVRSLQKSTYRASQELQMPQSSVWRILRKRLRVKGYRLQLLQALNPHDHNLRLHFCVDFQLRLEEEGYAEKLVFSDEATFHVCSKVNCHNVRIWGTKNPRETMDHVRDSPKVNVFCAVSSCKVYGPFFFTEPTVTSINYLDKLQLWLMSQLQEDSEDFIFQQDGAPRHFHFDVRAHLNANLPGRWSALLTMTLLLPWPPRSPDLTPCDFSMGLHQGSCVRAPYAT